MQSIFLGSHNVKLKSNSLVIESFLTNVAEYSKGKHKAVFNFILLNYSIF